MMMLFSLGFQFSLMYSTHCLLQNATREVSGYNFIDCLTGRIIAHSLGPSEKEGCHIHLHATRKEIGSLLELLAAFMLLDLFCYCYSLYAAFL